MERTGPVNYDIACLLDDLSYGNSSFQTKLRSNIPQSLVNMYVDFVLIENYLSEFWDIVKVDCDPFRLVRAVIDVDGCEVDILLVTARPNAFYFEVKLRHGDSGNFIVKVA